MLIEFGDTVVDSLARIFPSVLDGRSRVDGKIIRGCEWRDRIGSACLR